MANSSLGVWFGVTARRAAAALLLLGTGAAVAQSAVPRDLADLSLEELGALEVTSVSGRAESLSRAPASIYVITGEDIRRSGATSLPEALRLAPNLQVARIDAGGYAISARGFNSSIANKLLVLIDGRTVYTPLFSGVFWDMQDLLLADVERIEVISGPGATLWGANAVNGVINVITLAAAYTPGLLATVGGGNRELGTAVRYGGTLGASGNFRFYGKAGRIQNTRLANGNAVPDGWDRAQVGFRADWGGPDGDFTVQGDAYAARSEQRGSALGRDLGRVEVAGANLLTRGRRKFEDGSDLRIQAYYDHTDRDDLFLFRPRAEILDLDVQHSRAWGAHQLLMGGGYRWARDEVRDGVLVGFLPASRNLAWANLFVQDEVRLGERLGLTLGLKLERNDYTGTESLPSVRLAWEPSARDLIWGAASRAVRAPARLDREFFLLPPSSPIRIINGGPNFVSEVANVFELGYRGQPQRGWSYSVAGFHYDWDRLRSGQPAPAFIENQIGGEVYGVESWAAWQVAPSWRLTGGITTLRKDLRLEPGSTDPTGPSALGNDPDWQWSLRSAHQLAAHHQLDVLIRRVGELPVPEVPVYLAVDLRYAWRVGSDFELSLTAQNLSDPSHPEFGAPAARSEIGRGVFLEARWTP